MSPDERELWVTDNVHSMLHVFDATVMPPKWTTAVSLPFRGRPGEPPILRVSLLGDVRARRKICLCFDRGCH